METAHATDVSLAIDRWAASGLITSEQAEQLRRDVEADGNLVGPTDTGQKPTDTGQKQVPTEQKQVPTEQKQVPTEQTQATSREHASLVVEALGYLGGVIITVAIGLVVGRFWPQLTTTYRLILAAFAVAILVGAGAAIPPRLGAAGIRLRSVLWLAATVAWAGLAAIVFGQVLSSPGDVVGALVAAVTLPPAAVLWRQNGQPLQHLGFYVTLVAGTATSLSLVPGPAVLVNLMVWSVGMAWFVLAWGAVARPRWVGLALGSTTAIFATMTALDTIGIALLELATLAGFVIASVVLRDFVLLIIAALGTLLSLPRAIELFFPGALAAAFTLLVVGGCLIGTAVLIARRRRSGDNGSGQERRIRPETAHAALSASLATVISTGLVATMGIVVLLASMRYG